MATENDIFLAIAITFRKRLHEAEEGPISTFNFVQRMKEKLLSEILNTQESSLISNSIENNETHILASQLPPSSKECNVEIDNTVFLNTQELVNPEPSEPVINNNIDNLEPISVTQIKDFKTDYLEIRKAILRMTKQNSLTFQPTKKKLLSIYDILYLHSKRKSKFDESNMLSSAFLKLMTKVFEIPLLTDKHLHELFKIILNCYLVNFNNFINCTRTQFKIIFQFTFDVLNINSKSIDNYGQSFFRRIANHKAKTQLTQIVNENDFQILLYYLVQLIFLLLQSPLFQQKDIFFAEDQLRKLLAFLIINNNSELLRIFHKSRLKLQYKQKSK